MTKISDAMLARLQKLADKQAFDDDHENVVYDYCGGNVDDAYGIGADDGEINLARAVLADIKANQEQM